MQGGIIIFVYHKVHTGDAVPVKAPIQIRQSKVISHEVTDMLDKRITEPSTSLWSTPVLLAKNLDRSWHFCVDYRRPNEVTNKDVYPIRSLRTHLTVCKDPAISQLWIEEEGTWRYHFIRMNGQRLHSWRPMVFFTLTSCRLAFVTL